LIAERNRSSWPLTPTAARRSIGRSLLAEVTRSTAAATEHQFVFAHRRRQPQAADRQAADGVQAFEP